jgi:hypothetical protein
LVEFAVEGEGGDVKSIGWEDEANEAAAKVAGSETSSNVIELDKDDEIGDKKIGYGHFKHKPIDGDNGVPSHSEKVTCREKKDSETETVKG